MRRVNNLSIVLLPDPLLPTIPINFPASTLKPTFEIQSSLISKPKVYSVVFNFTTKGGSGGFALPLPQVLVDGRQYRLIAPEIMLFPESFAIGLPFLKEDS